MTSAAMGSISQSATSAYHGGMVTPLLALEAVAATFAMSTGDQRDRRLRLGVLRRFVPQWSDVPFVSIGTGRSTVARVWDGDSLRAMAELLLRWARKAVRR